MSLGSLAHLVAVYKTYKTTILNNLWYDSSGQYFCIKNGVRIGQSGFELNAVTNCITDGSKLESNLSCNQDNRSEQGKNG